MSFSYEKLTENCIFHLYGSKSTSDTLYCPRVFCRENSDRREHRYLLYISFFHRLLAYLRGFACRDNQEQAQLTSAALSPPWNAAVEVLNPSSFLLKCRSSYSHILPHRLQPIFRFSIDCKNWGQAEHRSFPPNITSIR